MLTMRFFVSNLQIKANNDLTGSIPSEIGELTQLDYLYLGKRTYQGGGYNCVVLLPLNYLGS